MEQLHQGSCRKAGARGLPCRREAALELLLLLLTESFYCEAASVAPAWPLVPFFAWDQKHDDFRTNVGVTMPYFERTSTQNSDFDCLVKGGALWLRSQMVLILPLWSRTVAIELLLGISSCGATALGFQLRLVDLAVEAQLWDRFTEAAVGRLLLVGCAVVRKLLWSCCCGC